MKEKYAELILLKCLKINKNQPLVITYSSNQKYFVEIIKKVAKKYNINDIREVESNPLENREILMNSNLEKIKNNIVFDRSIINKTYAEGGCLLKLYSTDFNNYYNGIENEKLKLMNEIMFKSHGNSLKAMKTYDFPYCIAAVPTKEWADIVFPNEKNNLEKLWVEFLKTVITIESDYLNEWDNNIKSNNIKRELLNNLKIKTLKFKNSLGTDLEIGIPNNAIWLGTEKENAYGKKIIVNMPTYEVFTAPHKLLTNGIVVTTKPLIYKDKVIESLKMKFKNGKVVNIDGKGDYLFIKKLIEEVKGLDYLGECALIDVSSPISKNNTLFYNDLLNENASSHLALGNAYPMCLKDGNKLTTEELKYNGLNSSNMHLDFMIGNEDMSIIASDIYNNSVEIIKNGEFQESEIKELLLSRK